MVAASVADALSSCSKDVSPPIASCTPSLWGDTFTSFSLDDQVQEKYAEAIKELKDEALSMLMAHGNTTHEKLVLIDTLERLGVAYHFDQEIEDQLQEIFNLHSKEEYDHDLFTTALRFRLLRQHRHHASSSVFDKFKDEDNKFKETLNSDAKALLSLYEAAHLRIHGEEILEEALVFSTHHLNRIEQQLDSPLQEQVKRALEQSLHRGVSRIETRYYISFYEKDNSRNQSLLKLAKLDFNYLQNMYKNELYQLTRWWSELELKSKLPYTRDTVVESYFWGTALHFEPQYAYVRVAVAKAIQMLTVMDDIYDHYATSEEANLFTQILERWSINESDRLPDDMKMFYRLILSIYDEYEREAAKQGKSFAVPYAKETVKQIARAYNNKDRKPFKGQKMPTFEDYLANSVFTSCIYVIFTSTIPSVKSASRETIDWLMSDPKIVIALAKMCQHDLASLEGVPKGLDNYMKQQNGVSMQETLDKFVEVAEEGWKDVNAEWISETASIATKDMVELALNYARAAEFTYKSCHQDGLTNPEKDLAPLIVGLFVDPIIL